MAPLAFLAVIFVVFVLAVVPTRRLAQAGWRPPVLLFYLLALMGFALVAIELRGPLRLLIPLVVLLYLLPFAVPPHMLVRLARRRAGGPTPPGPRNVTPPGTAARVVDPPQLGRGPAPGSTWAPPSATAADPVAGAPDDGPPEAADRRES